MSEPGGVQRQGLEVARQRAVDTLMENFANDVLDMAEFEKRLDVANESATEAELEEILADLPATALPVPAGSLVPARGGTPVMVSADRVKERAFMVSCMGGNSRVGRWVPPAATLRSGSWVDSRSTSARRCWVPARPM